jgi:hypothetical protein
VSEVVGGEQLVTKILIFDCTDKKSGVTRPLRELLNVTELSGHLYNQTAFRLKNKPPLTARGRSPMCGMLAPSTPAFSKPSTGLTQA